MAAASTTGGPGFAGDRLLVGPSTDDAEEARRLVAQGADYIGCGTVYPTSSKANAGAVIGLAGLQRVVQRVGGILLLWPAGVGQPPAGAVRVEFGQPRQVHPPGQAQLRQEHGTELAGPDQRNAHGLPGLGACAQHR